MIQKGTILIIKTLLPKILLLRQRNLSILRKKGPGSSTLKKLPLLYGLRNLLRRQEIICYRFSNAGITDIRNSPDLPEQWLRFFKVL